MMNIYNVSFHYYFLAKHNEHKMICVILSYVYS